MQSPIAVPTPAALADLVERCRQIDRYSTQLTAAEETRIAALAAALVSMRPVLELTPIARSALPGHHRRVTHWNLVSGYAVPVADHAGAALGALGERLVLDEHGQIKVLANRSWRGMWRTANLWRDGVEGLTAAVLLGYLAQLVELAQRRAPDVAQSLVDRRDSLAASRSLVEPGPRGR